MAYGNCGVCGKSYYLGTLRQVLRGDRYASDLAHICDVPDEPYVTVTEPPHPHCQYCGERIKANSKHLKSVKRSVFLHISCYRKWIENGKRRCP